MRKPDATRRSVIFVALATSIGLLVPAARAQERVLRPDAAAINPAALRSTPEIWVVRGEGSPAPRMEPIEVDPAPARLTLAEKSTLVKSLGKIMPNVGPWQVSPGDPKVTDRLWLLFRQVSSLATNVDPANTQGNVSSYAIFNPPFVNHGVWLSFMPPAPGRYLVDCRVKKLLSKYHYRVEAYPSGVEQTFIGADHLLWIYDAVQTGYASFHVKADGDGQPAWQFYSCEVTPLEP
jgi:hypothetical protein